MWEFKMRIANQNVEINFQDNTIICQCDQDEISREALTTKRQLLMHITADSSFGIVLNLIKAAGTAAQLLPLRVRIEHNDVGNRTSAQRKIIKDMAL